jgi:GAF domain-containing protein
LPSIPSCPLTPDALLPPDEAARLGTLRHYDVFSTAPDDVFNDLVALAAHAFQLPLAFLALVDEQQVCFHAQYGTALTAVPRAQALCSSAILHPHVTAYENLAATPQTGADAQAIRAALALGNGFYAAAPLRMPDGHTIGVFCLAGPQPRSFSADEQLVLEALAEVTSLGIAVRHLCRATPEFGPDEWADVRLRLCADLRTLRQQLNGLLAQHASQVPLPAAVLEPLRLGLQVLRMALAD